MTTITALNVRLGMDVSNFSEGANLARNETNRVAAIMRQSVPVSEKYKQELDLINRAFSETGKKSKEYANAIEHLRTKYNQLTPAANKAASSIGRLNQSVLSAIPGGQMLGNILSGTTGRLIAMGAAAAIAIRGMTQAAERIDTTAKAARTLGVAYGDLAAIQMMASETAGLDADSVNRGLGQFVKRLAEARVEGGKLKETLTAIGLDVDKLASMGPAEAFKAVSTAIAGIADKSEQIRIATLLVGKEGIKMVEVFRQGGDAAEKFKRDMEDLKGVITEEATAGVEAMNDAFGRAGMALDGIWETLLSGVAPILTEIAKITAEIFIVIRKVAVAIWETSAGLQAAWWLVNKMLVGIRAILAIASDLADMLSGNFDFEKTNKMLDEMQDGAAGVAAQSKMAAEEAQALAIEAERAADAAEKQEERYQGQVFQLQLQRMELMGQNEEAQRLRLEADGYSEVQIQTLTTMRKQNDELKKRIDAEKEAVKENQKAQKAQQKAIEEAAKAEHEAAKAFQRELEVARNEAMKFFEEREKQNKKMRDDVSAGPGAGIEAGSAGEVKFRADAANRLIGAAAVPDEQRVTQRDIAKKTAELVIAQREANAKAQQQIELAERQLAEMQENGFRRVR